MSINGHASDANVGVARKTASTGRWLPPLLLLSILVWCCAAPRGLVSSQIHTWNWYHYYLGSKYFTELGYTGLYEQTLAAQLEDHGPLQHITKIRDLHTYQIRNVRSVGVPTRCPSFSDARWQAFKRDVAVLVPRLPVRTWRRVLRDRGYNATPAWDAPVGALVGRLDLANTSQLQLMKWVDVVGLLTMVTLMGQTFGWWTAVAMAVAILAFPANSGRFMGGMIKYDWLYAILLVPVLLRRNRPFAAGAALGVAACMRVFPAVFLLAFIGRAAWRWLDLWVLEHRRVAGQDRRTHGAGWNPQVHTNHRVFRQDIRVFAGFTAAAMAGILLGALPTGGFSRWAMFAEKITLHNREMTFGNGRVGLDHFFTRDLVGEERSNSRRANFDHQRMLALGVRSLLLGLLILALRRSEEVDGYILISIAFYALVVASHYYWSVLALWVLLGTGRDPPIGKGWHALGLAIALVPSGVWWCYAWFEQNEYLRWTLMDGTLLILFEVLLVFRLAAHKKIDVALLSSNRTEH